MRPRPLVATALLIAMLATIVSVPTVPRAEAAAGPPCRWVYPGAIPDELLHPGWNPVMTEATAPDSAAIADEAPLQWYGRILDYSIASADEVAPLKDARTYYRYTVRDLTKVTGTSPRNTAYLHPYAAHAYVLMREAAEDAGFRFTIWSGWRSWSVQERAREHFSATGTNLSGRDVPNIAHPCTSKHPPGLAVDLDVDAGSRLHGWLREHAAAFGFRMTRWDEPWEWQFVGIDERPPLTRDVCIVAEGAGAELRQACRELVELEAPQLQLPTIDLGSAVRLLLEV